MLAISKRYRPLKALSAGSLAFAVGLTGAAAYVGSNLVHQNLTFNKAQNSSQASVPAESSLPIDPSPQDASTVGSDQAVYTAPTLYTAPVSEPVTAAPVPVASTSHQPVIPVDPAPATSGTTTTEPVPGDTNGDGIVDPVVQVIDGATDPLLP